MPVVLGQRALGLPVPGMRVVKIRHGRDGAERVAGDICGGFPDERFDGLDLLIDRAPLGCRECCPALRGRASGPGPE